MITGVVDSTSVLPGNSVLSKTRLLAHCPPVRLLPCFLLVSFFCKPSHHIRVFTRWRYLNVTQTHEMWSDLYECVCEGKKRLPLNRDYLVKW